MEAGRQPAQLRNLAPRATRGGYRQKDGLVRTGSRAIKTIATPIHMMLSVDPTTDVGVSAGVGVMSG